MPLEVCSPNRALVRLAILTLFLIRVASQSAVAGSLTPQALMAEPLPADLHPAVSDAASSAPSPAPSPLPPKPAPPVGTPAAPPAVAEKVPDGMRPFAEVVKGMTEEKGLFTIYRNEKDELYLALQPDQLDHDYILSSTVATGLGIAVGGDDMYSGYQLGDTLLRFHRVNGLLFLVERNIHFRAKPNTPEALAVERSFADSVLGSLKIEAVEPKTKAVLVNMTPIFLADLPEIALDLTQGLGSPFGLDASKSYLSSVKTLPENLEVESSDTYVSGRPVYNAALADGRGLAVRIHYSLYPVPDNDGYTPRQADTRIGYFVTAFKDLSDDSQRDPFVRYIDRWDLKKLHPDAPMSPPVRPITYWLDDAIPVRYRQAVRDGILRWNKAFEKIGFENAIQVKQRPADADWDISDARFSVVRWFDSNDGAPAIGMHRANPYTGETLSATVVISDSFTRYWKPFYEGYIARLAKGEVPLGNPLPIPGRSPDACNYGTESIARLAEATEAAQILGVGPVDRVPEGVIDQYLSEIVSHEIGHTLGLRHNFKGSAMLPFSSLFDTRITRRIGTTSSVMDYIGPLIALPGQKQGDYYSTTIGPYDEWAIQYGYSDFSGASPAETRSRLDAIASRSSEPALQYATDEDTGSVDPTAAAWDYGREPLDFSEHQIALAHALFKRIPRRLPAPGKSYDDVAWAYAETMHIYLGAFSTPLKTIGGDYLHRDHLDQPGARPPVQVIPTPTQLRAFRIITQNLFDDSALQLPGSLLDRVLPDRWMHWDSNPSGVEYDPVSLRNALLGAQKSALATMFSPAFLARLEDQSLQNPPAPGPGPARRMDVAHLFDGVTWAVWSELAAPGALRINPLRRDAQRLYLDVMTSMVVAPPAGTPEDARAMARYELNWILSKINHRLAQRPPSDLALTATLEDEQARISKALHAGVFGQA